MFISLLPILLSLPRLTLKLYFSNLSAMQLMICPPSHFGYQRKSDFTQYPLISETIWFFGLLREQREHRLAFRASARVLASRYSSLWDFCSSLICLWRKPEDPRRVSVARMVGVLLLFDIPRRKPEGRCANMVRFLFHYTLVRVNKGLKPRPSVPTMVGKY